MLGDAAEDVGEPGLGIDIVHLGSDDQAVHGGGTLAAAVGAGEEPGFAAERDAAQRSLGGIVGKADTAVEEALITMPIGLKCCPKAPAWRRPWDE